MAQELFRDKSPLHPETVTVPRLDDKHLAQEVEDLISETSAPVRGTQPGAAAPTPSGDAEEVVPDWLRRLQEEEKESES